LNYGGQPVPGTRKGRREGLLNKGLYRQNLKMSNFWTIFNEGRPSVSKP